MSTLSVLAIAFMVNIWLIAIIDHKFKLTNPKNWYCVPVIITYIFWLVSSSIFVAFQFKGV